MHKPDRHDWRTRPLPVAAPRADRRAAAQEPRETEPFIRRGCATQPIGALGNPKSKSHRRVPAGGAPMARWIGREGGPRFGDRSGGFRARGLGGRRTAHAEERPAAPQTALELLGLL